jgi:hypothetical protein
LLVDEDDELLLVEVDDELPELPLPLPLPPPQPEIARATAAHRYQCLATPFMNFLTSR